MCAYQAKSSKRSQLVPQQPGRCDYKYASTQCLQDTGRSAIMTGHSDAYAKQLVVTPSTPAETVPGQHDDIKLIIIVECLSCHSG